MILSEALKHDVILGLGTCSILKEWHDIFQAYLLFKLEKHESQAKDHNISLSCDHTSMECFCSRTLGNKMEGH